MATLKKQGKTWHGRHVWYENGVRREKMKSMRTGDQRLAYQRLAEWERELEAGQFGETYSPEFTDASQRWINMKHAAVKPNTTTRYRTSLRMLDEFFKGMRLMEITKADLERFEAKRRRDPGRRLARHGERGVKVAKDNGHGKREAKTYAPVSAVSIRRDFACLSTLMAYGVTMGWCRANVAAEFLGTDGKRKSLKATNARTRYLSHAEEARLLAACAQRQHGSEWDRKMFLAAVELSIITGLRKDELLGSLDWRDVQIGKRSTIAVRGKGDKIRKFPLLPRGVEIVTGLSIPPTRPAGPRYVICREDGRRYGSFDKAFDEACKRAGIEDLNWHDLRRTCGCRLLQDMQLSMEQVRDWFGHSSVVVTEQHYAFLRVEDLHDAVERYEQRKLTAPPAEIVPLRRRKAG